MFAAFCQLAAREPTQHRSSIAKRRWTACTAAAAHHMHGVAALNGLGRKSIAGLLMVNEQIAFKLGGPWPRLALPKLRQCPDNRSTISIPDGEFPALEELSLSALTVNPGSLLNSCQCLRVLSITQLDKSLLPIMLPPSGEFPMLEKLTLSGNIADLGILLNGCPLLRILSVTLCGMGLSSLNAALSALENAAPLGLTFSTLGIEIPWGDDIGMVRFTSLLCTMERLSPHELVITDNFDRCHGSHDRKINGAAEDSEQANSEAMALALLL
jgi:hypothetical protein